MPCIRIATVAFACRRESHTPPVRDRFCAPSCPYLPCPRLPCLAGHARSAGTQPESRHPPLMHARPGGNAATILAYAQRRGEVGNGERKRVVKGKSVSVHVDIGGVRIINKTASDRL